MVATAGASCVEIRAENGKAQVKVLPGVASLAQGRQQRDDPSWRRMLSSDGRVAPMAGEPSLVAHGQRRSNTGPPDGRLQQNTCQDAAASLYRGLALFGVGVFAGTRVRVHLGLCDRVSDTKRSYGG